MRGRRDAKKSAKTRKKRKEALYLSGGPRQCSPDATPRGVFEKHTDNTVFCKFCSHLLSRPLLRATGSRSMSSPVASLVPISQSLFELASESLGAVNTLLGAVVWTVAVGALVAGCCYILVELYRFCTSRSLDSSVPSVIARHILVSDEDHALAMKEDLLRQDPATLLNSFARLAIHNSDCWSGGRGGALGRFGPGEMAPEIDEVVFRAPVMVVQGPVQTSKGYHLILVLERYGPPVGAPGPAARARRGAPNDDVDVAKKNS
jgi:peptidyl-prolyl cis-trans isomerase C